MGCIRHMEPHGINWCFQRCVLALLFIYILFFLSFLLTFKRLSFSRHTPTITGAHSPPGVWWHPKYGSRLRKSLYLRPSCVASLSSASHPADVVFFLWNCCLYQFSLIMFPDSSWSVVSFHILTLVFFFVVGWGLRRVGGSGTCVEGVAWLFKGRLLCGFHAGSLCGRDFTF